MHRALAVFILALTVLPGCGAARRGVGPSSSSSSSSLANAPARAVAAFPTRDQLSQIAAQPARGAAPAPTPLFRDAWQLEGPFPDAAPAPIDPAQPLAALLLRAIDGSGATASTLMECTARELARFQLGRPNDTDQRVIRFAAGRCGSTAERTWMQAYHAPVPSSADASAVLAHHAAQLQGRLREDVARFRAAGATDVGLGLALDGRGTASVVLVGAAEQLALTERAPIVPADRDHVILRGRLEGSYTFLTAVATFGTSDYTDCDIASSVALPQIAIRCPVHATDSIAWIDVLGHTEGRVLGHRVARVLVRRDDAAQLAALAVDPSLDGSAPGLVAAILARANAIRAEHGRGPLVLELAQSATVQGITPAWFGAELGGDQATSELITLGLVAGWDVTAGTIRDAHLAVSMADTTRSPGEWLALMMEDPIARAVLLDPDARAAAIGAQWDAERSAFTGLVVTYELFEDAPLERARDTVLERLTAARARRGLPPPRVVGMRALETASQWVQRGQRTPGQALDRAMQQVASSSQRGVRAWLVEGIAPEGMEWPEELVSRPTLTLGASMAWYRVPGAAWGQYAFLALIVE